MTGIYLKCDKCGATIGGEDVSGAKHGLSLSEHETLRSRAKDFGWTFGVVEGSVADYCPSCSDHGSD